MILNPDEIQDSQPTVSLVIGAGGIKSAAAVGVYDVLRRQGVRVRQVVGCSGGSIYAGLLALGLEPEQVEAEVRRLWTRDITQIKRPFGYMMGLLPRHPHFLARFALRDDRRIMSRLEEAFGTHRLEHTYIPLLINATDFKSGQGVVFHRGRIVDAVRASIAIPGVFRPFQIGESLYCDGLLTNPLPIDLAAHSGAEIIIAVGFQVPTRTRINNLRRYNLHVNSILTNSLLRANITYCQQHFGADVLVLEPQFETPVRLFDTKKIPHVIAKGADSMRQQLGWLEETLLRRMRQASVAYPFVDDTIPAFQ